MTRLGHQVVHRPAEERALRADTDQHIGHRGDDLLGGRPVGREVVLAAQLVVVHMDSSRTRGRVMSMTSTPRSQAWNDRWGVSVRL